MHIKMGDERYEFDPDILTVAEARYIKKHTGLGLKGFGEGMQTGDPDVLVAMLAIAKMRTGVTVQWSDFDNMNLGSLDITDDDAPKDADGGSAVAEADEVIDPTLPTEPLVVASAGGTTTGG